MGDAVFFKGWSMEVSSHGVSCGGKRFSWHEIMRTARTVESESILNDIVFGAIGVVLMVVGLSGPGWVLGLGAVLLVLSVLEAKVSKRPEFVYFIYTASGRHEIYRTRSPDKSAELQHALERAAASSAA